MPPVFAPGVDKVGSYDIDDPDASATSGHMELFRTVGNALDMTAPVWQRGLDANDRKHGHHDMKWDGKVSGHGAGADLPDDWLSPEFSPYKLRVTLPGGSPEKQEAEFKVEVASIDLTLAGPDSNKVFMNDPAEKVKITALVKLKKVDGSPTLTPVPLRVTFSFADPGAANTAKTDSFKYDATHWLGKKGDADLVHFEAHISHTTTSDTDFKKTCRALAIPDAGADQGKSRAWFLPSGVGGDEFTLKAAIIHTGGARLGDKSADKFVIWRFVKFDKIYEMNGETHVSVNGATGVISPVFDPAFVRYTAGAPIAIDATHSVKYLGLWGGTATPQKSWATVSAKTPAETPTAQEITDATYNGADPVKILAMGLARAAIILKAQAWADRIDTDFNACMDAWVTAAAIPENALVAIKYYHPKYSHGGGDYQTTQWRLGGAATPAWLRVGAFSNGAGGHYYTNLDPDGLWVNWGGLSHGSGRVTVPTGNPAATVKQVVRHEAGHATNSFFKREDFGPSLDHSVSNAGIMYFETTGGTTFTDREKKILRGIVPPP